MKRYVRALGIDDAPFKPHTKGKTFLIGCVVRAPNYLEGVLRRDIEIDGRDVTEKIISMMEGRFGVQVKVIMMNGVTFGGFNVADLKRIHRETSVGIISVVRKRPDIAEIESALKKHFSDWEDRLALMKNLPSFEYNGLFIHNVGMSEDEAKSLIKKFTVRGKMPEPIRMAHIIASGILYGESRGKA